MVVEFCPTPAVEESKCSKWCGTHCGPRCCASSVWLTRKAAQLLRIHKLRSSVRLPCGNGALSHGSCIESTLDNVMPLSTSRRKKVIIWQGERNADGKLSFMYWPVTATLLSGFRFAHVDIVLGLGFSLAWRREVASLKSGDMFVWVGVNGKHSQPWKALRERGVRTVMYNTEPILKPRCELVGQVDELWDFSWFNIEQCNRSKTLPENRPVLRYVPPGHLSVSLGSIIPPEKVQSPELRKNISHQALMFFGSVRHGRSECIRTLQHALGSQLQWTYNVWTDPQFDEVRPGQLFERAGCGTALTVLSLITDDASVQCICQSAQRLRYAHASDISQHCLAEFSKNHHIRSLPSSR